MSDIIIRIPEKHKQLAIAFERILDEVVRNVNSAESGKVASYDVIERELGKRASEIERASHESILTALDIDAASVEVGGILHRKVGRSRTTYHTLAGDIQIERTLYRRARARNAKTVDPVSLRAGVVGDGWLPATARAMAFQLQSTTSRDAEKGAAEFGRAEYSRSSYERVGHLVGQLYVDENEQTEDTLIRELRVPDEAYSVVVSIDRVSVPMEEPRQRPPGRPPKNAPKKPVSRNYRMAYAACISICDNQGQALHTIRYGRMPNGDPVELCEAMAGDIMMLQKAKPHLKVVALADGAKENWNLFEGVLTEALLGKKLYRFVDLFHLLEKLGAAAKVIFGNDRKKVETERWKFLFLNNEQAVSTILDELYASGKEWTAFGDNTPVHEAITYLENNGDKMNYVTARKLGLPVGSGNVEATCKSLFELRFKRCGARWKNETGDHIAQLRALALSDRWARALELTLRPLQIPVRKVA